MDLFDPKPELTRRHGQPMQGSVETFQKGNTNTLMASPFRFHRHGECGMELSEVMPHLGGVADLRQRAVAQGRRANDVKIFSMMTVVLGSTEAEAQAISQALQQTGWHRKRAAQLLRISYRCLLYKINQYKITPAQTLAPSASAPNLE